MRNAKAIWIALLFSIFAASPAPAEEPAASLSPLWVYLPLTAGVGYLIAEGDQDIYRTFHDHRDDRIESISRAFTRSGDGVTILGITGLTYGFGYLKDDSRARDTARLGIESLIVSGLISETIKHTAGRQRPIYADGEDRWNGPRYFFRMDNDSFDSFPSGHSTAAFALATTFALQYPDGIVPYLAYAWAAGVAASRVYNEVHWTSDVLVGSTIGLVTARAIHRFHEKNGRFFIVPGVGEHGWRLSVGTIF